MPMNKEDLARINSITKYPSIQTYHEMDRGNLLEKVVSFEGQVVATEQIDGTNARMIMFPAGDWFIGSREELLYAKGDMISNPSQGIVDALEDWAYSLNITSMIDNPTVIYLEVYGGKIGKNAVQYTSTKEFSFQIFDIAEVPTDSFFDMLNWEPDKIAHWRDNGGQHFLTEEQLVGRATTGGLGAPLVPRLLRVDGSELPQTVSDMAVWMKDRLVTTNVALDDRATGHPEGMVLRTLDRRVIAKARFEDYNRTLQRRHSQESQR